ncbi:MAG TPA: response regulator [Blastocatellia bacterium]|nr:response regulator [Blastocatellia bacterium]
MINALIVDDEQLARERLRGILAPFADVEVVAEADSGADAVIKIEKYEPELLFLDVRMPGMDGFETLRMVETEPLPLVIFVTAYDQYAVAAFEANAVDYLLKPASRRRLEQALDKVREKLASRQAGAAQLNALLQAVARRPESYLQRLPVRAQNRILILPMEQIALLRIDRGLVRVTTDEGEFRTRYTSFTEMEGLLDPQVFLRIHRQVIVNLNHVREITSFDKHSARLTLRGGQQAPVSRSHLKELREAIRW